MPSIECAGSYFGIAPAQARWFEAMATQDLHEMFDCRSCQMSEVPVCAEGKRLQAEARAAHEQYILDRYGEVA